MPDTPTPDGTVSVPRLSLRTLDAHQSYGPGVEGPAADPRSTTIGIVHLGVGAFHRAHQAVFTEDAAAATGDSSWGILGVTQRSPRVVEQLRPQDGLYGVLTKGRGSTSLRVIGSMRGIAFLRTEVGVLEAVAAPTTHIVSSTVSEKGYRRSIAGGPDLADPDLAADVATLRRELAAASTWLRGGWRQDEPARTPIGALARGLLRRFAAHGAPLTVVCCDNMVDNGRVVRRLLDGVLDAAGPSSTALREWAIGSVRFPVTMVDRITPATTEAHRCEAAALLGLRDEALVVAEPFSQWVIADEFAGPRPRWELAGAIITDDVAPWEQAKLRMLNGTHSAIAYLGALRGHRMIDQAMRDPQVADVARRLMDDDAAPTLTPPRGLDLDRYRDDILARFANPSTGYTTLQVAADGSQKLPIRVLGTVADRLRAGAVPTAAARALAAWMVFVARGRDCTGRDLPLDDPLASQLREAADGDEAGLADRMLAITAVFDEEVRGNDGFVRVLRAEVADLLRLVP